MISAQALDRAVAEAVVTAEQATRLREIEATLRPAPEPQDEESLRFITGFADIFVTIGLVLFLGALAFLMDAGTGSTLMYAGLACCAWLLAEFFTLKRRMALPSIVLLVVFVGAIFVLSAQIAAALLPHTTPLLQTTPEPGPLLPRLSPTAWSGWSSLGVAAVVAALLAFVHYVRFQVPITVAAGAASLCVLVFALVAGLAPNIGEGGLDAAMFLLGVAVFALAMRFDMSDPERATRRADIAFWLHLLAAPLVVQPLIRAIMHHPEAGVTTASALGILWIFLALGVLAVIIDRRAMLVSALVSAGVALGSLIHNLGYESNYVFPLVLFSLGAFILLLSAGWQPLRRALLRRLPDSLARRLPHPLVTSNA